MGFFAKIRQALTGGSRRSTSFELPDTLAEWVEPWGSPTEPAPQHLTSIVGAERDLEFLAHVPGVGDIWALLLPGDALVLWHRLAEAHPSTGWYPVVMSQLAEDVHDRQAASGDPTVRQDAQDVLAAVPPGDYSFEQHSEWWSAAPTRPIVLGEFFVALIPTRHPWLVPQILGYRGGPGLEPWQHTSVLRHWFDAYGARIWYLEDGELRLAVTRGPEPDPTSDLARELHAYAPEWVDIEVPDDPRLSGMQYWQFVWD